MDTTIVYFIYGLAFFSMGLAMLLEAGRSPLLADSFALLFLALFGLVHGGHEWLEMFLDESQWLVIRNPVLFSWLRVVILTISFVALLIFGLRMFWPQEQISGQTRYFWIAGLLAYTLLIFLVGAFAWFTHGDRMRHLDAGLRYLLAVPAATLAGLAMYRRSRQTPQEGRAVLRLSFLFAALGFLIYAATQMVVPPLDTFPGNFLNTASFQKLTGLPIQVVRAATAVVITISLLQSIRIIELERQKEFLAVQQARVDALEQVRLELVKRESLRQELLRHIVTAQEDERARIARELHDETAQMLVAFSFHLAALRKSIPHNQSTAGQIQNLQNLSRQMSERIYRLMRDLRPAQLDDLGLAAALEYLIDEVRQRLDLQVRFQIKGERRRLDPLVETALFRVAQEALTNVARHAGVSEANMELRFEAQQVALEISDQGTGFGSPPVASSGSGWGLAGMRERAESIGGTLTLVSSPGTGTLVRIIVPITPTTLSGKENLKENLYKSASSEEAVWKPSA